MWPSLPAPLPPFRSAAAAAVGRRWAACVQSHRTATAAAPSSRTPACLVDASVIVSSSREQSCAPHTLAADDPAPAAAASRLAIATIAAASPLQLPSAAASSAPHPPILRVAAVLPHLLLSCNARRTPQRNREFLSGSFFLRGRFLRRGANRFLRCGGL